MGMEAPGLVKANGHLSEYLGWCSFPCGCLAFSPHQLLSLNRCHHRKTFAAYHVTLHTHRHSWEGFQAVAFVRHTAHTFVVARTHLSLAPSPHPQWVSLFFKLKIPCSEKQAILVVCIKSPTVSLTPSLL